MKIGDKVKIIKNDSYYAPQLDVGNTGVIVAAQPGDTVFAVKLDSGFDPAPEGYLDGHAAWAYYPRELEVIQ